MTVEFEKIAHEFNFLRKFEDEKKKHRIHKCHKKFNPTKTRGNIFITPKVLKIEKKTSFNEIHVNVEILKNKKNQVQEKHKQYFILDIFEKSARNFLNKIPVNVYILQNEKKKINK